MSDPKYSIIVPVYNRPDEISELLHSLTKQTFRNFEVVVVEDGSTITCRDVIDQYIDQFSIHYLTKPNTGPGPSRNEGFGIARGECFVVFDSDCIVPPHYLAVVDEALQKDHWDAWGGPDRAHHDFTLVQKAMGYTMSSIFTTGGIRGGKKHVGWFQPRSFNMGMTRRTFELTKGFRFDRFAEDIELSVRMKQAGLRVGLIPDAFVYHKRRTNFQQFFRQVYNFGRGRVLVGKQFPEEVKLTHWFPFLFTCGLAGWVVTLLFSPLLFKIGAALISTYLLAILIHGTMSYKSLAVGLLSVPAALVQLTGYGFGFISEKFK